MRLKISWLCLCCQLSWFFSFFFSKDSIFFFEKCHEFSFIRIRRIFLVLNSILYSFFKDLYNIRPISSWYKMKRKFVLLRKLKINFCCFIIHIDFVCQQNAKDIWTIRSHFFISNLQVLVCYFPGCIENKYSCISLIIIAWMQTLKTFLSSCISNIHLHRLLLPSSHFSYKEWERSWIVSFIVVQEKAFY